MTREHRIAVFGLAALLLLPLAPAYAQPADKGIVQRSSDGKPITRTCNAAPDDLEGLKAALRSHEYARAGFMQKMRFTDYSVPRDFHGRVEGTPAAELVASIAMGLATQSEAGETVALIYDTGLSGGKHALCVWLLSRRGLEAAATVPLPNWPLARIVQNGLKVTSRAAARAPQRRAAGKSKAVDSDGPLDSPPVELAPWVERPEETLSRTSQILLPPSIRAKLTEISLKRLLILPAVDLSTIPFAALPLESGALVDRAAIVVLADIDGMSFAVRFDRPGTGGEKLVIGDPDLSRDKTWTFVPLPGAREEANAIATALGVRPLIGPEAKSSSVLSRLRSHAGALGLAYFATHGIADRVNPMDGSFLALAERHLYAREIRDLQLKRQPLVVMSACQTGLGKVFEGGVFGLARAWYYAGASQVLTSLWNIDDAATRDLMTAFVRQLRHQTVEDALRQAMIETREHYPDPALWAGFAAFGYPTNLEQAPPPAPPFRVSRPAKLRLQNNWPTNDAVARDALQDFYAALRAASGSSLELEILPIGTAAPAYEALDVVHRGVLDAAWSTPAYSFWMAKALGLYSGNVPLGLDPSSFVRWVGKEGAAQANAILSETLKKNVLSVPCGIIGPSADWFAKPLGPNSDLKGLKFRTLGLGANVASRLGAYPVQLAASEIVPAIERGVIDGSDWLTPLHGVTHGFPSGAKHLYFPGWTRSAHLIELIINTHKWNELDEGARDGIVAICRQNLRKYLDKIPEIERRGLEEARRRGVAIQSYPPELMESIRLAARSVLEDMAKQDPDFARMLASYDRYR